ncbi:hypothetical protein CY0110_18722 [Crocosphaera chwakensis CCY0110]|uniref:Uncharacterized protein n=1 Tax=Crocosphaera chwakensis CCY0110 TaxID=391612 RepID=A3IJ76_9CHRO|nr:hypothetical protein CY0110_18722 [Crocosphaera chwakensis CCY0110]
MFSNCLIRGRTFTINPMRYG